MENEGLILSFMEISNLPIDDAKRFLESAGYNLELAIQNYYDSNSTSQQSTASSSQTSTTQNSQNDESDEIRPAIPREYDILIQAETSRDIQLSTVRQQFSSFRDLKREMEIQEELVRGQNPKRKYLEDIYRHPVDIAFNLDFYHAKFKGQKSGKWIAILINNESFESLSFNRDIFNEESQRIKNILRKNFIFLRRNCDDIQALKILQIYNLLDSSMPVFLIIDSITGELKKNFKDCTKLSLKSILRELKKYSCSKDKELVYNSSYEDSEDDEDNSYPRPGPSKEINYVKHDASSNTIKTAMKTVTKSIESDEESFGSISSNNISDVDEEEEPQVLDSDEEALKREDDGPQTNILLRMQDETHKFKYPAKRTVANLINYIYRNYLIQTGIYDNKTKRFSLISKIHNKCLTMLDQEMTLEKADIHPSIVLLHNTLDKE